MRFLCTPVFVFSWRSAPRASVAPRQAVVAKKERRFNIIGFWFSVFSLIKRMARHVSKNPQAIRVPTQPSKSVAPDRVPAGAQTAPARSPQYPVRAANREAPVQAANLSVSRFRERD